MYIYAMCVCVCVHSTGKWITCTTTESKSLYRLIEINVESLLNLIIKYDLIHIFLFFFWIVVRYIYMCIGQKQIWFELENSIDVKEQSIWWCMNLTGKYLLVIGKSKWKTTDAVADTNLIVANFISIKLNSLQNLFDKCRP